MPIRIIKLCVLITAVGLAIYFVSLNSNPATITVGAGSSVTASTGTIVLTSFALGLLLAFLAASIFAIKGFFREQGFKKREKKRLELQAEIIALREAARSETSATTEKRYQKLIKRFPQELLAYLEYIEFLLNFGKKTPSESRAVEALKIIAESKQTWDAVELLFLSVEAYEQLGNTSSALEALSLIIHRNDAAELNRSAGPVNLIRKAATLSGSLLRYNDALEFLQTLSEYTRLTSSDIQFQTDMQSAIIIRDESDEEARLKKLFELLKKQDQSVVGLTEIARLQEKFGMYSEAAESLTRLFKLNGNIDAVRSARTMWLNQGNPQAAVAVMKQWIRSETVDAKKVVAQIELAKTYLLLSQDDDALKTLEEAVVNQSGKTLATDLQKEISILKAMIMYRKQDARGAQLAFSEVESLTLEHTGAVKLLQSSR